MINVDMKQYAYYSYGEQDAYGQAQLSDTVQGFIKMSIYTTTQGVQENVKYKDASYIGLTNGIITDKDVIQYGEDKLKVLYVQPRGRFKQVFMKEI
jgi:hypothetical protein